jgi:ATP-dependent Clp protease ATP-binding subunit ClpB
VGKTELARTLAEFLFDSEQALVRLDMSEYMEKHSVARLIGAPPGYVGFEEGGQLTEAVRRRPYCVILFDEIEKAHQDVFNVLLQILDDGRLTDGHGRTVDFKNTVVMMTSNVGSHLISSYRGGDDPRAHAGMKDEVLDALRKQFRPEFLNRLDEIVVFHALTAADVRAIVDIQLGRLQARLAEHQLDLVFTDGAKDLLATHGYDPVYGARPLKRAIQNEVETALARRMIAGELTDGMRLTVDAGPGGLTFESAPRS